MGKGGGFGESYKAPVDHPRARALQGEAAAGEQDGAQHLAGCIRAVDEEGQLRAGAQVLEEQRL